MNEKALCCSIRIKGFSSYSQAIFLSVLALTLTVNIISTAHPPWKTVCCGEIGVGFDMGKKRGLKEESKAKTKTSSSPQNISYSFTQTQQHIQEIGLAASQTLYVCNPSPALLKLEPKCNIASKHFCFSFNFYLLGLTFDMAILSSLIFASL